MNQTNLSTTHQNITENNTHDLHASTADIKENEWKSDDISHVTSKLNNASLDHSHKTDLKPSIRQVPLYINKNLNLKKKPKM